MAQAQATMTRFRNSARWRSPALLAAPMSAAWHRTPTAGLRDALQRSSERGDDDAIGGATIGQGASGGTTPRLDLGGKSEPGSAAGAPAPSRRAPSEEAPTDDRSEGSVEDADARRERSSDPGRADTVAPDGNARTVRHDPDEPPERERDRVARPLGVGGRHRPARRRRESRRRAPVRPDHHVRRSCAPPPCPSKRPTRRALRSGPSSKRSKNRRSSSSARRGAAGAARRSR